MQYKWQSVPESISAASPSRLQTPLIRQNVPTGTVASRIHLIQSLANPTGSDDPPKNRGHRHETSRTSFGKRLSRRFAQPALRNMNAEEDLQLDSAHSYLGLNTPRKNHEEEYAISKRRNKYDRAPGIHRQLKPQGMKETVQCDASSSFTVVSNPSSAQNPKQIHIKEGMRVDRGVSSSSPPRQRTAEILMSPPYSTPDPLDVYRQEFSAQIEDMASSRSTMLTTSSVRRKSVRGLFRYHGIEKPSRLASSENMSHDNDETPRPETLQRPCHACSWVNNSIPQCWRCGHWLCEKCDDLSAQSNHGKAEPLVGNKINNPGGPHSPDSKLLQEENQKVKSRLEPIPDQIPKETRPQLPNNLLPLTKLQPFDAAHIRNPGSPHQPTQIPPEQQNKLFKALSSRAQPRLGVKDSPFMIADILSRRQPLHVGIGNRDAKAQKNKASESELKHRNYSSHLTATEDCTAECRATHDGYHPYRHSSVCIQKQLQIREELERGYVADASRDDDFSTTQYSLNFRKPPSYSELSSPKPAGWHDIEYIECHGYPRTGHGLRGTPTEDRVVGECQHCLDDCQCASCKSIPHQARCCLNHSHHSIQHLHNFFSKKRTNLESVEFQSSPLPSTPSTHGNSQPAMTDPINTVIPPNIQANDGSTTDPEESKQKGKIREEQPPPQATGSLPRMKPSIFKNTPEIPTPLPWVSAPRDVNKLAPAQRSQYSPQITPPNPTIVVDLSSADGIPIKEDEYYTAPSMAHGSNSQGDTSRAGITTSDEDGVKSIHSRQEGSTIPHDPNSPSKEKASRGTDIKSTVERISPQGSRAASRRLSKLFQPRKQNTLQRFGDQYNDRTPAVAHDVENSQIKKIQLQMQNDTSRRESFDNCGKNKKRLKLKAGGNKTAPIEREDENGRSDNDRSGDGAGPSQGKNESPASCCSLGLGEKKNEKGSGVVGSCCSLGLEDKMGGSRSEESGGDEAKDLGVCLKGFTVIIRFEGRENVVLEADL